ncbi:hypothetical protein HOP50_01g07560 [Chloropicon primus]|uniref:Uncharacterized protein n=2 Tax=Chloropicon primus TaxID=1764295 RepID=A0A5B8MDL8_9CHLO|nr:hypothetical protein A3770_01p07720 [Chloropicon primus]UPQ97465.1 hypothetical protein HOP50_01g07560 [Chloropicon primus]|eukprot:QDZ18254.1 hypothetical protein A3770_01p07720 [Chloropicon primus]
MSETETEEKSPVEVGTPEREGVRSEEEEEEEEAAEELELVTAAMQNGKDMSLVVDSAAGALEDMDTAIKGLRDWQREHSEQVARLEKENENLLKSLLEQGSSRSMAEGQGDAENEAPAAENAEYLDILNELKKYESRPEVVEKVLGAVSSVGKTELSEEKLRLVTSAAKMTFAVEAEKAGKSPDRRPEVSDSTKSILQEADELLQSLASEEDDQGLLSGSSNDAIAWSSDLQSVLSKLEMLESPSKQVKQEDAA